MRYMEKMLAKNSQQGIHPSRKDIELWWRTNVFREFRKTEPIRDCYDGQASNPSCVCSQKRIDQDLASF